MASLRSPEDLLTTELKEIYSAERQLARVIPRLAKKVSSDHFREMLEQRQQQSAELMDEIDDALEHMDAAKGRPKNIAAEGLIDDATQHLDDVKDERLIDPLLLASVQKIEHYCIAAWSTAAAIGRLLDEKDIVKTMEKVLGEGKRFDDELTKLAEEEVNPQMMEEESEEEEEGSDEDEGSDEEEEEAETEEASPGSGRGRRR